MITCTYKYHAKMPPVKRELKAAIEHIGQKWRYYNDRKLELHVSPFYYKAGRRIWQIVFDFDRNPYTNLRRFVIDYIYGKPGEEYFRVENTGKGYHLVSTFGIILPTNLTVEKLRQETASLLSKYGVDVPSSIRDLPIRRTPSVKKNSRQLLVASFSIADFLSKSRTEMDLYSKKLRFKTENEFKKYLRDYTFLNKLIPFIKAHNKIYLLKELIR